jgi:putative membrane protein
MSALAQILIAVVALEHLLFLVLEMFLWDKPQGMKVFRNTPEAAAATKVLAGNQGLYNGFLAAGLVWALFPVGAPDAARALATFFLACVIAAGLYGALSFSRRILWVQAVPAAIALAAVWFV